MKNINAIRKVLEETLQLVEKEELLEKPVAETGADLKKKGIKPAKVKSLEDAIIEWKQIEDQLEAAKAEFNASIKKQVEKQEKLFEKVESMMTEIDTNMFAVNDIVAKMKASYERESTKYADLYKEALTKVNAEAAKILTKLHDKYTTPTTVPGKLTIESKQVAALVRLLEKQTGRKVELKENFFKAIIEKLKGLWQALTGFKGAVNNLKKLAQQAGDPGEQKPWKPDVERTKEHFVNTYGHK